MSIEPVAAETVGERLRRLRLARGLSQRELSSPGVSYAYISRIEAGARRPSVKALRMLAEKLGVSADYLETGAEIHGLEWRDLRLTDAELRLRLGDDTTAVEHEFRRLLEESERSGDAPAAARARIGLAFASETRGDHDGVVALLEQATATGLVSPLTRPDVYATLGRSLAALGQPERAVAVFTRCLEQVQEDSPADDAAAIRFASYLASALTDLGDYDGAQAALRAAVRRSERITDPYARVRLYWSLGRVAGNSGRHQVSLGYFRRALALLQTTEDTLHVARAHLACAWALMGEGELEEADAHLHKAEVLFGLAPAPVDEVMLRRHQADLARRRGDAATAAVRAREAIDRAGEALPGERGGAWLVLAEAQAMEDDPGAERSFEEAARLLDQHGSPRERAECYRAWGRLLRRAGREEDALDVLERAADYAADVGLQRSRTQ